MSDAGAREPADQMGPVLEAWRQSQGSSWFGAPADEASGDTDALPAFLAEVTENGDESDEAISDPEEPQPHAIAAE